MPVSSARSLALLSFLLIVPHGTMAQAQMVRSLPVDDAFSLSARQAVSGAIIFDWTVADGYYLYRDKIHAETISGQVIALETSDGETKKDPYFGPMQVYHRKGEARLLPDARAGLADAATIELTYQGCQDGGICYRPEKKTIDLSALSDTAVPIAGPTRGQNEIVDRFGSDDRRSSSNAPPENDGQRSDALSSRPVATTVTNLPKASRRSSVDPQVAAAGGSGIVTDRSAGWDVAGLLGRQSRLVVLGTFLALGVGLAFTPCVFPMYPILAGQLSRVGGRRDPKHGLLHSSAYVFAMALAFGVLGVAAAWSGANLQVALQSPSAIISVTIVFLALALSSFGVFSLSLPSGWVNAVNRRAPQMGNGIGSSFGLGFASALIVGPCVTAPLAGALIYIAQTGDLTFGATALFVLGLGQGLPLIFFGTVGSSIMPKSGAWMLVVSKAFGVAFLAMAIWMLSRIVSPSLAMALWALLALGVGTVLASLALSSPANRSLAGGVGLVGIVALVYGASLLIGALAGATDPLRPFIPLTRAATITPPWSLPFESVDQPGTVAAAIGSHDRPTLLYFTADWCVSCAVIEREVFENPDVRKALTRFRLLKVDLTTPSPGKTALADELSVVGPPTMLFLNVDGREALGTRSVGELTAQDFLNYASSARGL